jgi:hypothetical protein
VDLRYALGFGAVAARLTYGCGANGAGGAGVAQQHIAEAVRWNIGPVTAGPVEHPAGYQGSSGRRGSTVGVTGVTGVTRATGDLD